ncbi:hypothetical protein V7S43_014354 [Phytophthora oleae]|uniref:Uncharacterized protein n=1 Tax=Phytophthora oleae TaxID=2107226 RepID=A0ABD3F2V8_9STRA
MANTEEVDGDAEFASFPGERFRFSVKRVGGVGYITLKSQVSEQRWVCEVTDVGAFAPKGVMLPPNTVLHYVAASLKASLSTPDNDDRGPKLKREDGDKTLQLEILVKLGTIDFAWAPKYSFPLKLETEQALTPSKNQTEQIELLTAQVQELQEEMKTIKEQLKEVLRRQADSTKSQVDSLPSPGFTIRRQSMPLQEIITNDTSSSAVPEERNLGGAPHRLVKIEEYRETKNPSGEIERKRRPHTCKVCSALRDDGKRTSQTCHYCVECTELLNGAMVFLCDKVRAHKPKYQNATCYQIWHSFWNNGKSMPESGISSIRMRKRLKTSEQNEAGPAVQHL